MSLPTVVRGDSRQMFKSDDNQNLVLFLHIKFERNTKGICGYVALLMDIPSVDELSCSSPILLPTQPNPTNLDECDGEAFT
jgi:hypothetical protein